MHPSHHIAVLVSLLLAPVSILVHGGVVLNEVMYHPPNDDDSLQFIELHNPGPETETITGWKLTKGVTFTMPTATLEPGGFAVICRQLAAWQRSFGTNIPVLGEFTGKLKHGGERLELTDATGRTVDTFKYDDAAPWPTGPDGGGCSMERITPAAASEDPHNWTAALATSFNALACTPGRTNSAYSSRLPPVIQHVRFTSPVPGKPVHVTASIRSKEVIQSVELRFQSIAEATATGGIESILPMVPTGSDGTFSADLPAQPAGRLLRLRIRAADQSNAYRFEPAPGEPRSTFSAYLGNRSAPLTVPEVHLLQIGPKEAPGSSLRNRRNRSESTALRGQCALVYVPTNGGPARVFDHIRLTPRAGGWKARLHKDDPLDGMTTLNLVYEHRPRWILSEPLSYEVFRRTGVPAPQTGHVRLSLQGRPMGYHLLVEQPNASFLRRQNLDPDGNLYKLLWYGRDVIGQHEKKNNPESGHSDLLAVIEGLNRLQGDSQWEFIQRNFNVDELVNYFAASMCVQNWDGFFNNYFVHRAPGPGGRWTMIPWDQDKTWGDYDGASAAYDWYELPLTYGMAGDREPGSRFSLFRTRNSPWGSTAWWRPGGYFSSPLLANRQFRDRFLARLRVICDSLFTEQEFRPVIDDLEQRLEPEIRFRARLEGEDPSSAVLAFRESMESFRRQLRNRRAYLIRELGQSPVGR